MSAKDRKPKKRCLVPATREPVSQGPSFLRQSLRFPLVVVVLASMTVSGKACAQGTISAGLEHSLAIKSDGTVWAWGGNYLGELGDGTTASRLTPVRAAGLTDVASVAAGGYPNSFALGNDGSVWGWGSSVAWDFETRATPARVANLAGVIAIAGPGFHSPFYFIMVARNDGTLWTWGWGPIIPGEYSASPIRVPNVTDAVDVAAGYSHCLALESDGVVWAWGHNNHGQLGDGTTESQNLPVRVHGLGEVIAIATGGSHNLVVRKDGTVWAWGLNDDGQLGDGTTDDRYVPAQVPGLTDVVSVAAAWSHSLGLQNDGTLLAWGSGKLGRLGDGTGQDRYTPIKVANLEGVVGIAAGWGHNLAVKQDGTVWAWGLNHDGQLGDGTRLTLQTPVQVFSDAMLPGDDHVPPSDSDESPDEVDSLGGQDDIPGGEDGRSPIPYDHPPGSLDIFLHVAHGAGTHYLSYASATSPFYTESYQNLRQNLWHDFLSTPGKEMPAGFIGQRGSARTGEPDGDGWDWRIEYQGWKTQYRYSLASKSDYSGASVGIVLTRSPNEEFQPFVLQMRSYGNEILFELRVEEGFPFYELLEYDLSPQQFRYLPIGNDVPIDVSTSTLMTENPLPETPTGNDMTVSGVCGLGDWYMTLHGSGAPTASFTYSPAGPSVQEEVVFDASGSTDSDGRIVWYDWDFGDGIGQAGGPAEGTRVTHAYDDAGEYAVTLTVTDDTGLTDTVKKDVNICCERGNRHEIVEQDGWPMVWRKSAESGESLVLWWVGSPLTGQYQLRYYRQGVAELPGGGRLVAWCPFEGGCNTGAYFGPDTEGTSDSIACFSKVVWVSRDFGTRETPTWDDGCLDRLEFEFEPCTGLGTVLRKSTCYRYGPPVSSNTEACRTTQGWPEEPCEICRSDSGSVGGKGTETTLLLETYDNDEMESLAQEHFEAFAENIPQVQLAEGEHLMALTESLLGDLDRDGDIDERDLAIIRASEGSCRRDMDYDLWADTNGDGCIDGLDTATIEAIVDGSSMPGQEVPEGPSSEGARVGCGIGAFAVTILSLCVLGLVRFRRRSKC